MSGFGSVTEAATKATLSLTEMVTEESEDGDVVKFKAVDWVVFSLMLVGSVGIGVGSAFKNRKKATTDDYLLGGGNMPPLAVAISLMGGWISAISILGELILIQGLHASP